MHIAIIAARATNLRSCARMAPSRYVVSAMHARAAYVWLIKNTKDVCTLTAAWRAIRRRGHLRFVRRGCTKAP